MTTVHKNIVRAIRDGIKEYSGREVQELEVVEDPGVENTFVARAALQGLEMYTIFLLVGRGQNVARMLPEEVGATLEEVDGAWPPKFGAPRYFY